MKSLFNVEPAADPPIYSGTISVTSEVTKSYHSRNDLI